MTNDTPTPTAPPGQMVEIGNLNDPIIWQPTMYLRWRTGVLEQAWIGVLLGSRVTEWRAVPNAE